MLEQSLSTNKIHNFAPIIIPTLHRSTHFIRLMESLRRNTWAKYTEVYIGLDYPPSSKYERGYHEICEYLNRDFPDFANINIIKRPHNYGAAKNSKELRNLVLQKHDRFIYTDDDAEFSPNFLEYINKCLEYYANDPDVVAVTGYSYPIRWKTSPQATIFKENFSCPMWGTAFWREKFVAIEHYLCSGGLKKAIPQALNQAVFSKMLKYSQMEYVNCCLSPNFSNTLASRTSDVAMRMYTAICDKYVIVPTISKVRNHGFDGSGLYCPSTTSFKDRHIAKTYPYHLQPLDSNTSFDLIEDILFDYATNKTILDSFDKISFTQKLKTLIKLYTFKIIGQTLYSKLFIS